MEIEMIIVVALVFAALVSAWAFWFYTKKMKTLSDPAERRANRIKQVVAGVLSFAAIVLAVTFELPPPPPPTAVASNPRINSSGNPLLTVTFSGLNESKKDGPFTVLKHKKSKVELEYWEGKTASGKSKKIAGPLKADCSGNSGGVERVDIQFPVVLDSKKDWYFRFDGKFVYRKNNGEAKLGRLQFKRIEKHIPKK